MKISDKDMAALERRLNGKPDPWTVGHTLAVFIALGLMMFFFGSAACLSVQCI